MKRLISILIICFLMIQITGCTYAEDIKITDSKGNSNNTVIRIDKKYTLKDYQKEYTEDGVTVTIRYELRENN